jgi:hypothetical protein
MERRFTMSATIEVLRQKYADVMDNQAVTNATAWVLPNSAPEFSPDAVVEHARKNVAAFGQLMQQTFGDTNE